jgi:hypothetical protein
VAAAAVGTGLVVSIGPEYKDLYDNCARPCLDVREPALKARELAGYVAWGVAGAMAVVDVVLIALRARGGGDRRAWIAPTVGGVAAGGRF